MCEPPRARGRRGPERRSGVRRGGARLKAVLLIAIAAIAVLALEIVVNRESSGEDFIVLAAPPEELVGMWLAENPRYPDRALVIGYDHFELHLGEQGGIRSHPILSIRAVQGPDSWAYEIDYESSGRDQTLAIYLHPDGVLRFRNPRNEVWRRKPTS